MAPPHALVGLAVGLCVLFFAQPSLQQDIVLPPAIDEDLVAEGYIVLDPKAIERYRNEESNEADAQAEAKKEVEYILTQVNEYYKSLQPYGLNIQIRIVDIKIIDHDLVSGMEITNGDVVEEKVLLNNFGKFLPDAERSNDDYDFAMLFTGYNLSDPTSGFAQLGAICNDYARGVVELHGTFMAAGIFAHESGHIFGADHDPDGSPTIMAPKQSNEKDDRIFTFSALTADFILKNLREPSRNFDCLRQTNPGSFVPNLSPTDFDGKMQDVHHLCKRAIDPRSTPCTNSWFYNNETAIAGDKVCFRVACRLPDDPKLCSTVRTPEGMPCDYNKACQKGKCVDAPSPKTAKVNSQCLFGDDLNPRGVRKSCPEYIKEKGGQACENFEDLTSCCETCPKYETGWTDCPYGNLGSINYDGGKKSCDEIVAQNGRNEMCGGLAKRCCETCRLPDNLKGTSCPYGDDNFLTVNSEKDTCENTLNKFSKASVCQNNPYISKRCCKSCERPAGVSADCPYGDDARINFNKISQTCPEASDRYGLRVLCNAWGKQHCCDTCKIPAGAPSDCPYGDDVRINFNKISQTCPEAAVRYGLSVLCNAWGKQHCCDTCKIPAGAPSDCPYGNEKKVKVNREDYTCDEAASKFGKDWLCSSTLSKACCKTCASN